MSHQKMKYTNTNVADGRLCYMLSCDELTVGRDACDELTGDELTM